AGADLRPVLVDDLADQLGIDGPDHLRLARPEADLAVVLAAEPAFPVAVAGETAADPVRPDPGKAEPGPVTTATPSAERLQAHARVAARIARLGAGEMAHRIAGSLLQGDAEDVALSVPA